MNKPKTIFDLLTDITFNKVGWNKQTDHNKKQFSPYMINRLLSMDHNMIELVNYIQQYTPTLGNEMTYNLYLDILPKKKSYNKYINNNTVNKQQKIIDFLSKQYEMNDDEVAEILKRSTKQDIKNELKRYGFTDKQIKNDFKND